MEIVDGPGIKWPEDFAKSPLKRKITENAGQNSKYLTKNRKIQAQVKKITEYQKILTYPQKSDLIKSDYQPFSGP